MTQNFAQATDFIGSHLGEAIKSHSVYDISNRLTDFYTALTDAIPGTSCMRTRYTYDGITSRIIGTKEELSTWDSSWDI